MNDPAKTRPERLEALQAWVKAGAGPRDEPRGEVNNHVHTCYSFSPYTPSMAARLAWQAGLDAVGSVDHDSVAAATETLEAGKILGLATTVGFELRVGFAGTPFEKRRLNYPECLGKAYMVVHGVPRSHIADAEGFLAPLRRARVTRTRQMAERIARLFQNAQLGSFSFDNDVEPLSKLGEAGGVTERHLLAGAARRILDQVKNDAVSEFLDTRWGVRTNAKVAAAIDDPENPHRFYDLIGLLKTSLVDQVFIAPEGDECLPVTRVVEFARSIGAIPAYAYLGDVSESPTGDKKAEHFEDSYLDALVPELHRLGFQALTYMPPRNTLDQLQRVRRLCVDQGLLEISGVDINSSRQSFSCPEVLLPAFRHLNDSTWALVAHEKLASRDPRWGFFHPQNPLAQRPLADRIAAYAEAGRAMDPHRPETISEPSLKRSHS